jgi:hypothetical protein
MGIDSSTNIEPEAGRVHEWQGGRGLVLKTQGLANEKRALYGGLCGLRDVQVKKAALPLD